MPKHKGRDAYGADTPRGTCTAVIGSMTGAMGAQSLLAEAAIRAATSRQV